MGWDVSQVLWVHQQVPWIWQRWCHPVFFVWHAFLPWAPENDWRLKMCSLPLRLKTDFYSHIANFGASSWMMSPGILGLGRIVWIALYLRLLHLVGEIFIFWRKDEGKWFPKKASTLPQTHGPCITSWVTKKYIPVGSQKPPWSNHPGDISLLFWWFHECFLLLWCLIV